MKKHIGGFTMWRRFDPNPCGGGVGDCAVRAVALATGQTWREAFSGLCKKAYDMCDMPSANRVWGAYLRRYGFVRDNVPDGIFTLREFCRSFPRGVYVVAMPGHVATVIDGDYYDAWDSGRQEPLYFWRRA